MLTKKTQILEPHLLCLGQLSVPVELFTLMKICHVGPDQDGLKERSLRGDLWRAFA